ncbi:MAG: hypothetical protein AAGF95_32840 [Chloroflexota bacterium]
MTNYLTLQPTIKIRILFLSILLIFPFQLLFVYFFGEPYPALMMPAFAGTEGAKADGSFESTHTDILIHFTDGQIEQVAQQTLLANIPDSHHGAIMRMMFRPTEERQALPDNVQESTPLEHFIKAHIVPGYAITQQRDTFQPETHTETKQWLEQRIHDLYPHQTPHIVEFIYYTDTLHYSHNYLRPKDQNASLLRIEFS